MPGTRYNLIAKANWNWLGPAYKGLDADLAEVEAAVASGGGTGGGGVLVVDHFDGTATITVTDPAAASITDHGDGTITLTIGGATP